MIRKVIINFLKGSFLTSDDSFKNWQLAAYVVFLVLLMISSSHSMDKKVMLLSELTQEKIELKSIFSESRSKLIRSTLEPTIKKKAKVYGLKDGFEEVEVIKVIRNK